MNPVIHLNAVKGATEDITLVVRARCSRCIISQERIIKIPDFKICNALQEIALPGDEHANQVIFTCLSIYVATADTTLALR